MPKPSSGRSLMPFKAAFQLIKRVLAVVAVKETVAKFFTIGNFLISAFSGLNKPKPKTRAIIINKLIKPILYFRLWPSHKYKTMAKTEPKSRPK